jgi:serine/threonine-protein kinase
MTRALPPNVLRTPLLVAAICALASALWSLFLWQQLLVARSGGEAFCAFGGGCGALWDGPFASAVHTATGLPVAAWGLVWSGAALILSLLVRRRAGAGDDPEPLWSGVVAVAAAGVGGVIGLVAVSVQEGGFCSNCAVTYALVIGFAGVVATAAWLARPSRLGPGSARAGAVTAGLFLLLLFPGLQTPRAGAQLGAEALAGAGKAVQAPSAALEALLADMPVSEKQVLSNALASYADAQPVDTLAPRALIGDPMAPVRITSFTDSGCSHCAHFHQGLERVLEVLPPNTVAVDQRVFPLDRSCNPFVEATGREEVCLAARLRVCLEKNARAWELTTWLHRDAQPLSPHSIYGVGERLAPRAKLEACVASGRTGSKLRQDIDYALETGIQGTPHILVNGRPASTFMPFLYALGMTAGDPSHPAFASLPPPAETGTGHEGHAH